MYIFRIKFGVHEKERRIRSDVARLNIANLADCLSNSDCSFPVTHIWPAKKKETRNGKEKKRKQTIQRLR